MIVGNVIGGFPITPKSFLLQTEDGREVAAVLVGEETLFTATENDIRDGRTAGTEKGVIMGTKVIPAYHTSEGVRVITNGSAVTIPNTIESIDSYDYTKLQSIICSFNTTLANSVATEKVCINDNVYAVQSTESLSEVTKNHDSKIIELGIKNETGKPQILRYIMYKEIE